MVPAREGDELAAGVVEAGACYGVVPVLYAASYRRAPCVLGVFVWVVDDEDVYGPASEAAAYADSDEAASVVYYLKLVRIA